jgi:hypothetical protein
MAIVLSDTFTVSTLSSSTLNNALGGTVSASWRVNNTQTTVGVVNIANSGRITTDVGDAGDYQATILVKLSTTGKNFALVGRTSVTTASFCFGALWVSSGLRVSEWLVTGSRFDRASVALVSLPALDQFYKLQFRIEGMALTSRVLTTADVTLAVATYTTSIVPGGAQQNWGIFDVAGTNPAHSQIDDFTLESFAAAPSSFIDPDNRVVFRGAFRGAFRGVR